MRRLQNLITSPALQGKLTSRFITRCFGWLALVRFPKPLLQFLIRKYALAFDVQMDDYDLDLQKTTHFQQFFLRQFKPGKRSFEGSVAAPAEGIITAAGNLEQGQLMQVKGSTYNMDQLIQEPAFEQGVYITIYLGLGDYHHVHMPFDGTIDRIRSIPGHFFATNTTALQNKQEVYCQNERLIFKGNTLAGQFLLVLVGATCVGKIRISSPGLIEKRYPMEIQQGERMATFEMGSTVILILDNNDHANFSKEPGQRVLLGEKIMGL